MKRQQKQTRRGAIAVLAAFLAIVLVAMVAFSVDIGYVLTAKEELQRTADASALATCWEYGKQLSLGQTSTAAAQLARATASDYAASNGVTGHPMYVSANVDNDAGGDIVFGYVSDLNGGANSFQTGDAALYNAVQVRARKESSLNGEVPYFFARVFGMHGQILRAGATAAIVRDVRGFQTPADGSNLDLLPFALDQQTYDNLMAGGGTDDWRWNSTTKHIESGHDGIREINLYPQGTGSPGNRGTVDIGGCNNSTSDIARQILHGVSPQDLIDFDRPMEFDDSGKLYMNGDTGISAGVKDELAAIKGQPRIIPVFAQVQGPGNNAEYTIVKWFGIRIMDVSLTGAASKKRVTIQAAPIVVKGVIPSTTTGTSSYVYSPVVLIK